LNEAGSQVAVTCISLENIFVDHDITICNFLKMDIEGAEYRVLFDLPRSVFEKIQRIVLEYHLFEKNDNEQLIRLKQMLTELGYNLTEKKYDAFRGAIFARK